MPHQASLFSSDLQPDAPPQATSPLQALKVSAARLTPEQQRFNRLLTRVETLTREIEATRTLADTHRQRVSANLPPLQQRCLALMRELALSLDQRLQDKSRLGHVQRSVAIGILCDLSESLASHGDAEMRNLHDLYSEYSLSEKEKMEAEGLHSIMKQVLGDELEPREEGDSIEDVLVANLHKMQKHMQQRQADNAARQQARKQSSFKSAAQQQSAQNHEDAQVALRTIYRQLASALHPDREPDEQARIHKTALMGEANAAYERRDLMALLSLQLRIEQIDPETIARMTHEKIVALSHLLKEQAKALEHDLRAEQGRICAEFDLGPFGIVSAEGLNLDLEEKLNFARDEVAMMVQDVQQLQEQAGFKLWLKIQQQEIKRKKKRSAMFSPDRRPVFF